MVVQLVHKSLAEAHHLGLAFALGVKVRAALAAAHGQAGQAVLKGLLKAQKFDDRQIHRGVKTQAAFVGAQCAAVLQAVAVVHHHFALIVHPRHAEHHGALGFHHAAQHIQLLIAGIAFDHGLQRL